MNSRVSLYIIWALIGFAVIGVFSQLFTNPVRFFQSILILVVVVSIFIFLINRFVLRGGRGRSRELSAYRKAARRSQKRLKQKEKKRTTNVSSLKVRRRSRSAPHLTVIEGKKGKKKNRASF